MNLMVLRTFFPNNWGYRTDNAKTTCMQKFVSPNHHNTEVSTCNKFWHFVSICTGKMVGKKMVDLRIGIALPCNFSLNITIQLSFIQLLQAIHIYGSAIPI